MNDFSLPDKSGMHLEAFVLPDIGEGIVECEILQWHIQEGDSVTEDQVVVEVMTDKAVVEIPAKHTGKIAKIHYKKGDIAKVHTVLFEQYLSENAATLSNNQNIDGRNQPDVASDNTTHKKSVEKESSQIKNKHPQGESFVPPVDSNKVIASPAVRRIARELDVDLTEVKGSGKKNRILKKDLIDFEQAADKATPYSSAELTNKVMANTASADDNNDSGLAGDRVVALTSVQAAMAKHMVASASTIVHFSVSDELNVDKLIQLRQQLTPEFKKDGLKLSFMPFFIKALSLALLDLTKNTMIY